jgi:hypothetical protein
MTIFADWLGADVAVDTATTATSALTSRPAATRHVRVLNIEMPSLRNGVGARRDEICFILMKRAQELNGSVAFGQAGQSSSNQAKIGRLDMTGVSSFRNTALPSIGRSSNKNDGQP